MMIYRVLLRPVSDRWLSERKADAIPVRVGMSMWELIFLEENEKFKIPVNFLAYTTAMREPAYQI